MERKNKNQPGMRKKKIFPAVCDYLRSFNPFPDRNFNDVYVDFMKTKLSNHSFDTTRLSKWIQGNKSDLLKNPVYLDMMLQFISDTFETKSINPKPIATQLRSEFQNRGDAFYDFVEEYEIIYQNQEYLQYLTLLLRDETHMYNMAINPEAAPELVSDPAPKTLLGTGHWVKRNGFPVMIGLSLMLIMIIVYMILIAPEIGAKPTPLNKSGINQNNENGISSPQKAARFEQLPKDGQLIIPKGFYFQVQPSMRGNARQFKSEDTLNDIINFSSGVAKARANLFQKTANDFPTVIWENWSERYDHDILTLKDYPENNTIENTVRPIILYNNEQIIMFEYNIY